jgi:hypothetical protein
MSLKSYTKLELDLKDNVKMAEDLILKLHQICCAAPDIADSDLAQTNIVTKDLNNAVTECYDLLSSYLVDSGVDL